MHNKAVQSLWIGDSFSNIEKMSASSFVKQGHEYHLYCYKEIKNVPENIKIIDANEIIPESEIFSYQVGIGKGSYSAFSNIFRYKLIYERGGFWADTDVLCLKNIDFEDDYIFPTEIESIKNGVEHGHAIASCIFYCKKKSDLMKSCYEDSNSRDRALLKWGEIGPGLLAKKIKEHDLTHYCTPYQTFNPIPWTQVGLIFSKNVTLDALSENSYCIHLWNEMWRRNGIDKNAGFDKESLFEKLKNKFLQ